MRGVVAETQRQPLGLVLIIAPSNYPLFLPGAQLLQALVAGNAVLLKPGAGGLAAASMLAALWAQAGGDASLARVLPETLETAALAIDHGVDNVVLTGSTETGAQVLAALAQHLTPAAMELSGCDAALVRPDANLELVASALAFSLRLNGGATCIAPRRVFVYPPLSQPLEQRLVEQARELGPFVVDARAYAFAQQLTQQACEQGARLLCGGFEGDARMRPIVLADVTPAMELLHTDVLAPRSEKPMSSAMMRTMFGRVPDQACDPVAGDSSVAEPHPTRAANATGIKARQPREPFIGDLLVRRTHASVPVRHRRTPACGSGSGDWR
jgi:acyl-CoA reductase-like NAD-dependent aldehyde dehydrogenase